MATAPHAQPSSDPANDGSMLGMANQILKKFLQSVDDMLPARVVSYDRDTNRARVVPLVKILTTDNRQIGRAQVASVPVMQFGGGGFVLNFNLKPGDLGYIKANDRDISLFFQSYQENAPNSLRLHSFQDAVFIPDVMMGWVIAPEDAENAVLQTLDGTVKVSLGADSLKLAAPGCSITMGAGTITMVGAFVQSGGTATMAAVTAASVVTVSGINLDTHRTSGVTTGSGTSGVPVP